MPATLTLTAPDTAPLDIIVPTGWADVSFSAFADRWAPGPDEQRLPAEILCGLEPGTLGRLSILDVEYVSNLLEFSQDPSEVMDRPATPGLPDIGGLPFGLLLDARQHIEEHAGRPWLAYGAYVLALYRVQLAFGKYDEARVAACEAALLAAPCGEVYADAAFFLSQYKQRSSGTNPAPKTPPSLTTKNTKPGPKSLANALGRFSAWMRRQAVPS